MPEALIEVLIRTKRKTDGKNEETNLTSLKNQEKENG
jgi:hypothetical protein